MHYFGYCTWLDDAEVKRFMPPDEFDDLKRVALAKGFHLVAASPMTRSSFHAGDDFRRLKAARAASIAATA